jgi:hypothetical protein
MNMPKSVAMTALLISASFFACQDHHYKDYDKVAEHPKIDTSGQSGAAGKSFTAPMQDKAVMEYNRESAVSAGASKGAAGEFSGLVASGTVDVADGVKGSVDSSWVLFVMVRPEGGGPLYAATKIVNPKFPVSFKMTDADLMMGVPTAGESVSVEARLDSDGDAISKSPNDLIGGTIGTVTVGAENVTIFIDKQ